MWKRHFKQLKGNLVAHLNIMPIHSLASFLYNKPVNNYWWWQDASVCNPPIHYTQATREHHQAMSLSNCQSKFKPVREAKRLHRPLHSPLGLSYFIIAMENQQCNDIKLKRSIDLCFYFFLHCNTQIQNALILLYLSRFWIWFFLALHFTPPFTPVQRKC